VSQSLSQFATSIEARAKRVETYGNDLAIAGSKAMLKIMAEDTPVDTSEALSNWQAGAGSAPQGPIPPHATGSHGSTRETSLSEAITLADAIIQTKTPGQPLFISNTAKHIVDLDIGTSKQFAGGFVAQGLIAFHEAVATARAALWK
jgi:hypothetical protein